MVKMRPPASPAGSLQSHGPGARGAGKVGDLSLQKQQPKDRADKWILDSALFFVMGMSGWWTANALTWAEVPLLVQRTPEKQAIGTVLNLACQFGNLAPFAYKALFTKERQAEILPYSILGCQIVAILCAVACSAAWEETADMGGKGPHSVALVLCTVVAGGVGTLSNVTYWALCVRYPGTHCTKAMSVGMTVGGLILMLVAFLQGVGKETPRFSFQVFILRYRTCTASCASESNSFGSFGLFS